MTTQPVAEIEQTVPESAKTKVRNGIYISLRVKVIGTFVALFTIVFVVVSFWVVQFASQAALDQLGVAEDDAEFEIVDEPKAGLFGRTRGEARVRARVRRDRKR